MPTDALMSPLDQLALACFVLVVTGYGYVTGTRGMIAKSIIGAMQGQRLQWMDVMAARENRVLDGMILTSLGQGNAFFASTSAILIGGLATLLGSGEKIQQLLERIPYVAKSSPALWELKVLLIIAIFVFAFFKFAWAFRLSHYVSILIGATPLIKDSNTEACASHAKRTAQLVGIAAEHANSGLRAYYYAIAVMAWFFHPLLFIAATLWVMLILVRRDFLSRSLRIIRGTYRD
jgi:uncharacterized membrane protein